jgi:hypothetical protein
MGIWRRADLPIEQKVTDAPNAFSLAALRETVRKGASLRGGHVVRRSEC